MMAAAPDLEAVRRHATAAAAGPTAEPNRHEATTAPTGRRPDPERVVQARPAKATVASPHIKLRQQHEEQQRSRIGILVGVGAAVLVVGGLVWYFAAGPGRGGNVAVSITTTPAGVTVLDGDRELGTAPLVVKIPRSSEPHSLTFKKDGFFGAQRTVTPKENQALSVRLLPLPKSDEEGASGETQGGAPPAPSAATPTPTPTPPVAAKPAPPVAPVAVKPPPKPVADKPAPVAVKPPPPKPVVEPHHRKPKKNDTLILTPSF
jgi:hypothetical protein